ncbi:plakophilin-1 [Cololabis saira]|uniref:plakophilin-1 n=1 Tax=Cololabis saira TaxID=129043 RepID=UPI002AD341DC|nr:plakophilin-1 [Cololabis saira]
MMVPEPLRSATAIRVAEDTSLAVPSDKNASSRQQRVLDQVSTIKRSKSKHSKNGTLALSPTSKPSSSTYKDFRTSKFSSFKVNGTYGSNSGTLTGNTKAVNVQKSRTLSCKSASGRQYSSSGTWDQQGKTSNWPQSPDALKPSRSDPALGPPFSPPPKLIMNAQGQMGQSQHDFQVRENRQSQYSMVNGTNYTSSQTRIIRPPSTHSQSEGKMATLKMAKLEQASLVNSVVSLSGLTLKEAVEYLSQSGENYQQCGANFIQHTTFNEERAKEEVFQLGGIPPLVTLLSSPNPGVVLAAAGALRNLVFKNQNNKMAVENCEGVAKALKIIKESDSTETQKQITGLLWNLSSAEELKEGLINTALPVLTTNVMMPFTSWSDGSTDSHVDPSVFYFTTGCLRNLSGGQMKDRDAMRKCPGLIDSLMTYIQSCVAEENPDDESVENCTCILHNLTYQLEQECPESFRIYNAPDKDDAESKEDSTVGCFSPRSNKLKKKPLLDPSQALCEGEPSGATWLCHPKALDVYLSLLGSSEKDATLEASCGALQNLTGIEGAGSKAVSQILVQKLKSLFIMPSLLKSPNRTLQKTAMFLLSNLSRTSSFKTTMAKQVMPELTGLLSSDPHEMGNSDETIATACNTLRKLMLADSEVSKKIIKADLIYSLAQLNENEALPKSGRAASLLLHSLWNEKSLQSIVKKLGVPKSLFVNDKTAAAHQSLIVSDPQV